MLLLQEPPELQPPQMCMLLLMDPRCLWQGEQGGGTRGVGYQEEKEEDVVSRLLWWGGARKGGAGGIIRVE